LRDGKKNETVYFVEAANEFTAKIDIGSSHCIIKRKHGQQLKLEIKNGIELYFNTATESFRAFKRGNVQKSDVERLKMLKLEIKLCLE
jgi:hypothetical protein